MDKNSPVKSRGQGFNSVWEDFCAMEQLGPVLQLLGPSSRSQEPKFTETRTLEPLLLTREPTAGHHN